MAGGDYTVKPKATGAQQQRSQGQGLVEIIMVHRLREAPILCAIDVFYRNSWRTGCGKLPILCVRPF